MGLAEEWNHFDFSVDGRVGTLTFTRPDKLNALTLDVYADLRDFFAATPDRDDIDVLVVTGEGKGFCSGGDVDEIIGALMGADPERLLEFTRMTGAVIKGMRESPLPIIAAVNGTAAGAGTVIALAADFRIVAAEARFHFLFTKVGLAGADMGSAYLLPRLVGLGRATEILMFGDPLDAAECLDIGLANTVVPAVDVPAAAQDLARRIADGPTAAYSATKRLLAREQDLDLAAAIELEAITQAQLMASEDHAEFYAAYTEGREPRWKGK